MTMPLQAVDQGLLLLCLHIVMEQNSCPQCLVPTGSP
jgi:hypothetical protein